jgi:hypothetical protein
MVLKCESEIDDEFVKTQIAGPYLQSF